MAIRNIVRAAAQVGFATPTSAPIRVDPTTGNVLINTAGTGTTEKTLSDSTVGLLDSNGRVRVFANPVAKTISDGAATGLFSVAVPAGDVVGGVINFMVRVFDGTDSQVIAGICTYSAEAKLTVVVGATTYVAANEAKSVSAGTLTLAFTADVSVANVLTVKLQPTGSLTETTYTVEYTVMPIKGTVTIL
jgi:hypothetical protein